MSTTLLMSLTSAAVVALFVGLAIWVLGIARTLERIGGEPTSYLAKIAFGLRAIEVETGALPTGLGRLNETLTRARDGLGAIRGRIDELMTAVQRQERP